MEEKELKKKLIERISVLAKQKINMKQSEWDVGFDTGYKEASRHILDMILEIE